MSQTGAIPAKPINNKTSGLMFDKFGLESEGMTPAERKNAISGYDLKYRIEGLVAGITDKDIKHIYRGDGAATAPGLMVLPRIVGTSLFPKRHVNILLGYTAHEICHQLQTDFEKLEKFFADNSFDDKAKNHIKQFWNAIDDYRIEKLTNKIYPGFKIFINHTRDFSAERFCERVDAGLYNEELLSNPYKIGAVALTWVGAELNGYGTKSPKTALSKLNSDLRAWVEGWKSDLALVETNEDAWNLAFKIYEELEDMRNNPEKSDESDNSDQSEKSDDQKKGQSKTENNQSSSSKDNQDNESDNGDSEENGKDNSNSEEDKTQSQENNSQDQEDSDENGQGSQDENGGNNSEDSEGLSSENDQNDTDSSSSGKEENSDQDQTSGGDSDDDSGKDSEDQTDDCENCSSKEAGKNSENGNAKGNEDSNQEKSSGQEGESEDLSNTDASASEGASEGNPSGDKPGEENSSGKSTTKEGASGGNGSQNDAEEDSEESTSSENSSDSEKSKRPRLKIDSDADKTESENADLEIEELARVISSQSGPEAQIAKIADEKELSCIGANNDNKTEIIQRAQREYYNVRKNIGSGGGRAAGILRRMLQSRSRSTWRGGKEEGRLDFGRLVPMTQGHPDVYQQKNERIGVNTAVSLLLDNSGSMNGNPLKVCQETSVVLDMAIQGTKTNLEVNGFTSLDFAYPIVYRYRAFGQSGQSAAASLGNMPNVRLGGTPVSVPLLESWRRLSHQKEPRKIMIVVSDGGADWNDQEAARIAHDFIVSQGCPVLGISIGCPNEMKKWCDNVQGIESVEELPVALTNLVREVLK